MISEAIKKHYTAFWENEAIERCCLYISALKEDTATYPQAETLEQTWEDIDLRANQALWHAENMDYFAEGFPSAFVNFGPGCLTAMIGGSYRLDPYTVWFENEKRIADWGNPPAPVLRGDSDMFTLVDALTEKLLRVGGGKFFTSITDIGGTYDILAALRGTQDLLTDLYEYPVEVLAYVKALQPVWADYFKQYANLLIKRQGAMTSWMPIWSDKPYYPLQCDLSAMISPDMFQEFILPDLQYQTEHMERSIYHLDGPQEIPHLKHLLSLPRLNAIQWVPGTGNADPENECWFELYEEIQAAGKGIVLLDVNIDRLEKLLKHVSPKGLYIHCRAYDADSAQEIIRMAEHIR